MQRSREATHDLNAFGALLQRIEAAGFTVAVVGGCAVGAYAHLCGVANLSADLDLCLAPRDLNDFIAWALSEGLKLEQRPVPRAIQVAMFSWNGISVDVLLEVEAMPPAPLVFSRAREFTLSSSGATVLVADPFDLLANKLAVRRDKDLPHIDILRRFVDEEIVTCFAEETSGRRRIEPARRLLEVLQTSLLPAELIERMWPHARDALGRRFLASTCPDLIRARSLVAEAETEAERQVLEQILARRQG